MNDECDFIPTYHHWQHCFVSYLLFIIYQAPGIGASLVFLNSKILFNNKYIANLMFGEGNGNPLQYSHLGNPWMGEPGGLQSTGSQRVGHD